MWVDMDPAAACGCCEKCGEVGQAGGLGDDFGVVYDGFGVVSGDFMVVSMVIFMGETLAH